MGLSGKAARGSAITLGGQGVKFLVQAGTLVVLSRLLTPEAFGVVAIMTAVVAFTELFRDFGLTPAAIQAQVLTKQQASNLFWINSGIGLGIGLLLGCGGFLLARIFAEPSLNDIAPVIGAASLFIGMGAQYRVSLSRELKFTALTVTEVIGQVVGAAVAIGVAYLGGGIWALAFQTLATQVSLFICRALASSWQPGLPRPGAEMRGFYRYGSNLFGSQLLTYLSGNIDTYVIGLNWGASSLGLYNRAFTLMTLPIRQSLTPLTNVFLPVLSRISAERDRYFRALILIQFSLGGAVVFGYAMAVAYAPELVELVLGAQWIESATIFRLLAIGGAFQIFSHLNYWVFLSQGVTGSLLRYNLITKTLTVVAIIVASFYSVEAVALAYAASLAISWPINVFWLHRAVAMPFWVFIWSGSTVLMGGAIAVGSVLVLRWFVSGAALSVGVPVALALFVAVLLVSPATRPQLASLASMARAYIRGKRTR